MPAKVSRPARPKWLDEWSDYPHGYLEERRAREIVWYAIRIENSAKALAALLVKYRKPSKGFNREDDELLAALKALRELMEGK